MNSRSLHPGPGGPDSGGFEARLDTLLERYFDGDLAGDELAWMQARLEDDADLRAQVELQEKIDASLRRMHPADSIPMPAIPIDLGARDSMDRAHLAPGTGASGAGAPAGDAPVPISLPARAAPTRRLWPILAAAAVLLVAAGLFRAYWDRRVPDFNLMQPTEMYNRLVMMGFQPAVVCKTDPEFAALVKEKLGTALVATATPGVEVLGWGYNDDYNGSPISPHTMMLLARVDDREVLVFLDQAARDRELALPPNSNLKLFRREVGPIVAYEITPLDQPKVIPALRTW